MGKLENKIWDSPISIGAIRIKNRLAFPPITSNWANEDGSVNEKIISHYKKISEGGVGMVIVEGTSVSPEGRGISNSLCLYGKEHLSGLELLAQTIKQYNCFTSIQLSHAGGQSNPLFTGYGAVSPSGIKCKATNIKSRKLNIREIQEIRGKFVNSALLAYSAGFHAVELHLAHGYLLHEFLSEHTNKRKDRYGGNIDNRMRLILEIIKGIKEKNSQIILGARISGEDYLKDGINNDINQKILPRLEEEGISYFSITAGIYETSKLKHEAMKKGEFFDYAKKIKQIVSKPVIGVGKILDLESAEKHLRKNDCDIVAIGRGLIADPYMIQKIKDNKPFNKCKECGECRYLALGKKNLECLTSKEENA